MATLDEYTWIFVLSIIVGGITAFGIGANDLANSFASSVSTKALKLWQAVIIAAICEFGGAILLGAGVAGTIKKGVADPSDFAETPGVFMYGMFSVMCATALWDNLACHLEFPVSTTHTTVGAVVGFALAAEGGDAVVWYKSKDEFPFFSGVAAVVSGWVVSPLVSGSIVAITFLLVRTFVLRSKHSFILSLYLMPVFVGIVIGTVVAFIIQTGGKTGTWEKKDDGFVIWVSATAAGISALFTLIFLVPLIKRQALKDEASLADRISQLKAAKDASDGEGKDPEDKVKDADAAVIELDDPKDPKYPTVGPPTAKTPVADGMDPELLARAMTDVDLANSALDDARSARMEERWNKFLENKVAKALFDNKVVRTVKKGLFYDLHDVVATDKKVAAVWAHAEVFDYKTERMFRYLQVFSAASMAFAHGANDVANAMGPFSAVYTTWQTGSVPGKKNSVQEWVLAYGGAMIALGLATYGYKIMRVLGVKAVKLTNVRGFVVEWSTALTVVIASRYGLPVSTTQVATGAILSMGLCEGAKNGVNWRIIFRIFAGWVITLLIACGVAAAVTAFGIYSPNKNDEQDIFDATMITNELSYSQIQALNETSPNSSEVQDLNSTLTKLWTPTSRDAEACANFQVEVFGTYNETFTSA